MNIDLVFKMICLWAVLLGSIVVFLSGVFVLVCRKKEFFIRHPSYIVMEKEKGTEATECFYTRTGILCLLFGLVGGIVVGKIMGSPMGYYIPTALFLVWSLAGKWVADRLPVKSRYVRFLLICAVMALIGLLWWAISGNYRENVYYSLILPYAIIIFLLWLDFRIIRRW